MPPAAFESTILAELTATGTDAGFIVTDINFKIGAGLFVQFVN
jgi:hypothetical protein